VILLFFIYNAKASTIIAPAQRLLYTAPSYFYRPYSAFLWDPVNRIIVEIQGNNIFAYDVNSGIKRYGNPGVDFAVYNGAFVEAGVLYIWATDASKSSMYLLEYDIVNLGSLLLAQNQISGIDPSGGPSSTVCTVFDPTTNIAYVGADLGSMIYAVNVNEAVVVGSFNLRNYDPTLDIPLSAPCAIDVNARLIYFAATHYDPVLGNKYKIYILDISIPDTPTYKFSISVPGASFQVDTSTRTASGTDGKSILYQVDSNAENGTEWKIPGYNNGSGNGFVVVDSRDSSTFFFDTTITIGPVTLVPGGALSNLQWQTLPQAIVGPGTSTQLVVCCT
jgi:hypothetical protein